jgi:hypothetical protein
VNYQLHQESRGIKKSYLAWEREIVVRLRFNLPIFFITIIAHILYTTIDQGHKASKKPHLDTNQSLPNPTTCHHYIYCPRERNIVGIDRKKIGKYIWIMILFSVRPL